MAPASLAKAHTLTGRALQALLQGIGGGEGDRSVKLDQGRLDRGFTVGTVAGGGCEGDD